MCIIYINIYPGTTHSSKDVNIKMAKTVPACSSLAQSLLAMTTSSQVRSGTTVQDVGDHL